MAFPYDDQPPVRDPALPPTRMSDAEAAALSAQLNNQFNAAPAQPKMTDAQAAALSAELAKMPGGAPATQPTLPTVTQPVGSPATPLDTPGFVKGLVDLTDKAKTGVKDLAEEQINLNKDISDVNQAEVIRKQQELEQEAQIKAQAQQEAAAHDLEARNMAKQLASKTIDPEHYWNSKSTAGKIMATIGLMLGQVSAGLTKSGVNPALVMLNKAIDDDINSQKEDMNNGWKAYDKLHELDGDAAAHARYNDAWRQTHYAMGTELVKYQLGSIAAKTQNVAVKENANNFIQQLDGKQLDARKAFGDKLEAEARARAAAAASAAAAKAMKVEKLTASAGKDIQDLVQTGKFSEEEAQKQVYGRPQYAILSELGAGPTSFNQIAAAKNQLKNEILADLNTKRGVLSEESFAKYQAQKIQEYNSQISQLDEGTKPSSRVADVDLKGIEGADKTRALQVNFNGKTYLAPSAEDASKFRNVAAAASNAKKLIQEGIDARIKNSGGSLSPSATAAADQRQAAIIAQISKMNETGVLSDKEFERYKQMVPNSNDYSATGVIDAKLQALNNLFDNTLQSNFDAHVGNTASTGLKSSGPRDIVLPTINFTPNK